MGDKYEINIGRVEGEVSEPVVHGPNSAEFITHGLMPPVRERHNHPEVQVKPHEHDGIPLHMHNGLDAPLSALTFVEHALKGITITQGEVDAICKWLQARVGDKPFAGIGAPARIRPHKAQNRIPKAAHDSELQPLLVSPIEVVKAFQAALPGRQLGFGLNPNPNADIQIVLVDGWYLALTADKWQGILNEHPPRNRYVAERYDCDDFAMWFAGWVKHEYEINGVAWILSTSDSHSYNAILVASPDRKGLAVELVEPQADAVVPIDAKAHHGLTKGMVII